MSIIEVDCSYINEDLNYKEIIECYNTLSYSKLCTKLDKIFIINEKKKGSGAYGAVYDAMIIDTNDESVPYTICTVKIQSYKKDDDKAKQELINEIIATEYLRSLELDYIPEIYGYNWINTKNHIFGLIFMEKLDETLGTKIDKINLDKELHTKNDEIEKLNNLINKSYDILLYLHKKGIYHCDAHFNNYMINKSGKLFIIDY